MNTFDLLTDLQRVVFVLNGAGESLGVLSPIDPSVSPSLPPSLPPARAAGVRRYSWLSVFIKERMLMASSSPLCSQPANTMAFPLYSRLTLACGRPTGGDVPGSPSEDTGLQGPRILGLNSPEENFC